MSEDAKSNPVKKRVIQIPSLQEVISTARLASNRLASLGGQCRHVPVMDFVRDRFKRHKGLQHPQPAITGLPAALAGNHQELAGALLF